MQLSRFRTIFALFFISLISAMTFADNSNTVSAATSEKATFGMGCFWCSEAVFQDLKGVQKVQSGYEGGQIENPTYKQVCSGTTGHAEVIEVTYNPQQISYEVLLEIFWKLHDPTTLNRQGADVGTQYRSVIFYHNQKQKETAEKFKAELNAKKVFPNPIVTETSPASKFYVAENYHQDYYKLNQREPYCQFVIKPKMDKLEQVFKEKLK
jgi:peptide-methionine (S)-S-oxide reductase